MKRLILRPLIGLAFVTLLILLQATLLLAENEIDIGETFPEVALPAPSEPDQRTYLGLTDDQPFMLSQIKATVVLVEMLNVLCPHCRKQTKPYNELYRMIEADPETRGRVKMLGVAVANDDEAIEDFVDIYSVRFPVVSDRHFKLHRALRAGPTPFSLYVLRDRADDVGVIAGTHLGTDHDMDELFDYLKDLLTMQASDFTMLPRDIASVAADLMPPQSETEIAKMVKHSFLMQGNGLSDFRRLTLPSGRWVYAATLFRDGHRQPIFAEIASRSAICDICHSVHFFYLFDRSGLVLGFEPLYLTKHGNVEWSQAEIDHFTKRVVGKKLVGSWNFDSKLDAVSSATMTSAIIFDDLGHGRELLQELHGQNLLGP